ncbi:hypothetical protein KY386_03645 [Candidatus Parcubacteria bacterium]|nr:hypothetical protein [Candidatus Parcubacteria bacterium]
MKLITTLLGGLTVIAVTLVSMAYVLDGTLFEADYISGQAAALTGFYERAAERLPQLLAPRDRQAQEVLAGLVTPSYAQQRFEGFLQGLEEHYRRGGPPPQLDPADLALKAQHQGLMLPPEATQPIVYQPPPNAAAVRGTLDFFSWIKVVGPVAALLLLVAVAAVARERRFRLVAAVLLLAALVQGALYLLFQTLPGMMGPLMSAGQLGSLSPPAAALVEAVSRDVSGRFGWVGLGLLIAAAATLMLGAGVRFAQRFRRPQAVEVRPGGGGRINP